MRREALAFSIGAKESNGQVGGEGAAAVGDAVDAVPAPEGAAGPEHRRLTRARKDAATSVAAEAPAMAGTRAAPAPQTPLRFVVRVEAAPVAVAHALDRFKSGDADREARGSTARKGDGYNTPAFVDVPGADWPAFLAVLDGAGGVAVFAADGATAVTNRSAVTGSVHALVEATGPASPAADASAAPAARRP